jgi:hypothetical protein
MSPDMLIEETAGSVASQYDSEFLSHAANAVFHYFKHDLGLQTVSIGDFAGAFEKVLHGFRPDNAPSFSPGVSAGVFEFNLSNLAVKSGPDSELFFFPELRQELRQLLAKAPRVIRFHGLRACVKHLIGANKWSVRCQQLEDRIVGYLRQCALCEPRAEKLGLVIE